MEITSAAPVTDKLGRSFFDDGVESLQKEVLGEDVRMMTAKAQPYNDRTMLALKLGHVPCDVFGHRDILQSWSDMLRAKTMRLVESRAVRSDLSSMFHLYTLMRSILHQFAEESSAEGSPLQRQRRSLTL